MGRDGKFSIEEGEKPWEKRPSPKSWLVSSSAGVTSLLVRVDINQSILRFPSSLKLFFLRRGGGIELQANSCNRSPRQRWRRKHSIIHTSVPDTRLHDTKTEATKLGDDCFLFCFVTKEMNRQNMVWCDLFRPQQGWRLEGIFHRDYLSSCCRPVVSSDVNGNTKRWVLVSCDQLSHHKIPINWSVRYQGAAVKSNYVEHPLAFYAVSAQTRNTCVKKNAFSHLTCFYM